MKKYNEYDIMSLMACANTTWQSYPIPPDYKRVILLNEIVSVLRTSPESESTFVIPTRSAPEAPIANMGQL